MIVLELAIRVAVWVVYLLSMPLLVFTARTWEGRRLGWLSLLLVAGGFNWLIFINIFLYLENIPVPKINRIWVYPAITSLLGVPICLFAASIFLFGIFFLSRSYRSSQSVGVSSTFLGPVWAMGWQMALTPESDLLANATAILIRLMRIINRDHARQLRETMHELLDDMDGDPAYANLAPALPLVMFGAPWRVDTGHHYSYAPPHAPNERLGLILVLHGNGGNFAIMLHVWRAFADEHRCVIVCPTYGAGVYQVGDIAAAVGRHHEYALQRWPIDPQRVYLAGISDGGVGVSRTAIARPELFRGLILLSPTIDGQLAGRWRSGPVFVLQGGRDWNVSPRKTTACVEQLRAAGVSVEYMLDESADHFIWFSHREDAQRRLGDWLRTT